MNEKFFLINFILDYWNSCRTGMKLIYNEGLRNKDVYITCIFNPSIHNFEKLKKQIHFAINGIKESPILYSTVSQHPVVVFTVTKFNSRFLIVYNIMYRKNTYIQAFI